LLFAFAEKVKTRSDDCSDPADCGGVKVKEVADAMGLSPPSGCDSSVEIGIADVGVSGYAIENGPGVCVR
jgi:hypothetical protein